MTLTKTIIILFSLTCLPFIYADSTKYPCDVNNRPSMFDCFRGGAAVYQTCGYYTADCPFELCGTQASNGCHACSKPDILYYEMHDCEEEKMVRKCFDSICEADFEQQLSGAYDPVCAISKGCASGNCFETFSNPCKACETNQYPWFQPGLCESDRYDCSNPANSPKVCGAKAVCAFFDVQYDFLEHHATVKNAQTACSDPEVKYYGKGKCPEAMDGTVYCLPTKRPGSCSAKSNPVCGFYLDNNRDLKYKIMRNACTACKDASVIYHEPGPCVFKCNRNPFEFDECESYVSKPVCGTYAENGETKSISLRNYCLGCYIIPITVDTYTDGLCPGDEGLSCEPYKRMPDDAFPMMSRVCGYTQKGCRSSSCRRTYENELVACKSSSVQFFTERPCCCRKTWSCANTI